MNSTFSRSRRPRGAYALVLVLFLAVACARKPDDGKITSDVQSKFSQDSGLSSKQLTVDSKDGIVSLSGTVDNQAQRDVAVRQATSVPGVKVVVNNLQIGTAVASTSAPAPAPAPSAQNAAPVPAPRPAPGRKPQKPRNSSDNSDAAAAANNNPDPSANATADSAPPPPADPVPAAATQPPPPPPPRQLIIDQGTQVTVRLIDPIDSEKNQTNDTFHATLNAALSSDGEEAVPAGVELTGHLVNVKSAGKFAGQSEVVLQLDRISAGGKTYDIQTDQYRKTGSSRGKNTAEKVGGGAIIGGIIGAIAGGGKGAAIGSAAGAGVGGGVQAATKGQQIKLPSETILNFTLQAPVTVTQTLKPDTNRPKLDDSQQQ
jgi:hypothetical protein